MMVGDLASAHTLEHVARGALRPLAELGALLAALQRA